MFDDDQKCSFPERLFCPAGQDLLPAQRKEEVSTDEIFVGFRFVRIVFLFGRFGQISFHREASNGFISGFQTIHNPEKMDSTHQNTALLVMDMQTAVIRSLPDYHEIIDKVAKAIAFARSNSLPVLFVVVNFRPGMPEISPRNKIFAASKQRSMSMNINMDDLMKIDPSLSPTSNEIVITKRRLSAFTGSDLEVVLRAQSIQHLVLTGVATSGVVLSTLREAADKDFRITVLSDCCTDADKEVHQVLTNKVFPSQASVISLGEWVTK